MKMNKNRENLKNKNNWRIFRLLMITTEQYLDEMRTVLLTEQDFGSKW